MDIVYILLEVVVKVLLGFCFAMSSGFLCVVQGTVVGSVVDIALQWNYRAVV